MAEREELIAELEAVDSAIEELVGEITTRWAEVDVQKAERARIVEALGQDPRPQPVVPQAPAQAVVDGTQRMPAHSYTPVMVHRGWIPRGLHTFLRMQTGIYEVHLLPVISSMAPMPEQAPAVCGVRSCSVGLGNKPWERVLLQSGRTHAELCRRCIERVEQVEQASRTP